MLGNQSICDYVMPIISLLPDKTATFLGTCFLIKDNLYALTCKHVVDNSEDLYVLTRYGQGWVFVKIIERIFHEIEDIAIIKLEENENIPKDTFFNLTNFIAHSSTDYTQWSYPEDVVMEKNLIYPKAIRPDLVFLKGYIRRRVTNFDNDMFIKGSLYELSELGIGGCSGSPIIINRGGFSWSVIGIYSSSRTTELNCCKVQVGYAVRIDAVYEWAQNILFQKI